MRESDRPWHIVIDIGKTATLPCYVESNFLTDPNQIVWNKIDSLGVEFKISTGSVIHEPFLSAMRFSNEHTVRVEGQNKVTDMSLTIQGKYNPMKAIPHNYPYYLCIFTFYNCTN